MPHDARIACFFAVVASLGGPLAYSEPEGPIDPATDPTELLVDIFDENGWTPADAAALADRAIDRLLGEPVGPYVPIDGPEYTDDLDAYLADPDTDATALWYEAFVASGWTPTESVRFVQDYVTQLNPEDNDEDPDGDGLCMRYFVRAIYCINGEKFRRSVWLTKDCWENEVLDCIVLAPVCEGQDVKWYSLPFHCAGVECAWVSDQGFQAQPVPCSWAHAPCSCFYTDGEVFCDIIETKCCDSYKGCQECPCED